MSSLTYAQALNEAKQMIVQQQLRIKADAEKLRSQQQSMTDQAAQIASQEKRLGEQSTQIASQEQQLSEQTVELQRMVEETAALSNRCQELMTAKEQAEAIIDRQGSRLTQMQTQITEMEQRLAEQTAALSAITSELDSVRAQLPSSEDKEALFSMAELLAKRPPAMTSRKMPPMRMAGDDAASDLSDVPIAQAA